MDKYRQKRNDIGRKRAIYKHLLPSGLKSLIMSANRNSCKVDLSIGDYERIQSAKCVFCGAGRNINVIIQDSSSGLTIDNIAPCCNECKTLKGGLSYSDFVILVNKIASHLSRSGAVVHSGGEYEENFAKYERDKNNFDEA